MARAIDDRAGCAVIVKTLEALAGQQLESTVVACFSVQEEVGLRGAGTAAYQIEPDIALVLEATVAADVPGIPVARQPTRFGSGPAVDRHGQHDDHAAARPSGPSPNWPTST